MPTQIIARQALVCRQHRCIPTLAEQKLSTTGRVARKIADATNQASMLLKPGETGRSELRGARTDSV